MSFIFPVAWRLPPMSFVNTQLNPSKHIVNTQLNPSKHKLADQVQKRIAQIQHYYLFPCHTIKWHHFTTHKPQPQASNIAPTS